MMKVAVLAVLAVSALAQTSNPITKATQMLEDLHKTVAQEQEDATKTHKETMEFCRSTKQELNHNIDNNNDKIESVSATLQKATADISALSADIANLGASIAKASADKAEAKKIEKQRVSDFHAADKELGEAIDMLSRAINVLRKWAKGGDSASLMQVMNAVQTVITASGIDSASKQKLAALIQSDNKDDDGDDDVKAFGQPDVKAYENHSSAIVDTLANMKVDAEKQKTQATMEHMKSQNAHNLLVQGLDDAIASQTADKDRKTGELQNAKETKGKADGDLAAENDSLKENKNMLATTSQDCEDQANEYASQTAGRKEEMEAITKAIEVLSNPEFVGATDTRHAASFLQVSDVNKARVTSLLEGMARRFHSTSLAEIALKSRAAVGVDADNVFAKVMGMIEAMINKLKKQAASELKRHEYCVKNIAESTAKREKTQANLDNIGARLEKAESDAATLKQEIADLAQEISDLDAAVAQATKIRNEEAAAFAKSQTEFQTGLEGLDQAIKILTEYFGGASASDQGHEAHQGTASTIISMLQTANEDFTNGLAEAQATEKQAAADHDKFIQQAKVTKASKTAAAKAKAQESVRLASAIEDLKQDSENVEDELAAVNKALAKLNDMCTTKPVSFEDRMEKMTNEINGLKRALEILNSDSP